MRMVVFDNFRVYSCICTHRTTQTSLLNTLIFYECHLEIPYIFLPYYAIYDTFRSDRKEWLSTAFRKSFLYETSFHVKDDIRVRTAAFIEQIGCSFLSSSGD